MTLTRTAQADEHAVPPPATRSRRLGSWWVIVGFALILLVALGWRFIADPSLSAPTRDPAWYTWRAGLILEDDPGSIAADWGPDNLFSGGYRVTVPLAGALLQRVSGISTYSFSAFLMLGIPILTGLALGAGAFRSRRDPLVVLLTMLATAGLFLTTPYVGYLDNITVLFLLSLIVAFADAARTSWGARGAIFLIGMAAAFTHPTTCVLFGLSLLAVWGIHVVTSRFRFGTAMRSDGPLLLATGSGMVTGLALWVVGIWGPGGPELLKDAALPPPYTAAFFRERLIEWVTSMRPAITFPLILLAIVATVLAARRTRTPAPQYEQVAIWWMFPFAGVLTFLLGQAIPYYRFMNATAAPMALTGLGAYLAVRWLLRGEGSRKLAGALGAVAVVGALAWLFLDPAINRWAQQDNQWAPQSVRTSLAAAREVVVAAGERPSVLIVNYGNTDDATGSNTTYGWAKTYTNVFRTGLPGQLAKYQVTFVGTVEDFRSSQPSEGPSENFRETSRSHWEEVQARIRTYPEPPVVFLIEEYYSGLCNGLAEGACSPEAEQATLDRALEDSVEIGPGTHVLTGDRTYEPPPEVVERARTAGAAAAARFEDPPGPLADLPHQARVLAGLFALAVLPGLLAAPFFGLRDTVSRIALIPGTSIVLSLLAGIAVLGVWRGPLTDTKAWVVVGVAVGSGAALRFGSASILRALGAFGGFFNRLFSQFSNAAYATLMSVQFLTQAGQGMIQGAIGKSIAFGGQEGFDVQNVPSADYLLQVILLLYIPYTLLSPFIGVVIDRFERRRVVWWSNLVTAAVVGVIAIAVLLPLGKGTTEGDAGATAALVLGLLAAQAVIRVALAVKSAAIPDVLSGRDLLQGNALSQAGGALFQILGIAVALAAGGFLPSWLVVLGGAAVLAIGALAATRLRHVEARAHVTRFAEEARRVMRTIAHGVREVAARPAAAVGLSGFQMLRYQFWGFGLFVFALYAKNLVGSDSQVPTLLSGGVGLIGGVLGLIVAQGLKDRVAPIRLLLVSMALLGAGTLVFGGLVSVAGFAAMLFIGFFAFFLGKVSADTIVQQAMPDDFRGRAFALFDIAYNLGFIVPALVLSLVWVENDAGRTRMVLIVSGAVFLVLTGIVAAWARRIRDQFATQDDLIEA